MRADVVRSRHNPHAVKVEVSGAVHGIRVTGRTLQVRLDFELINGELVRAICAGRVHRADGTGKALPHATQRVVETAVWRALLENEAEG